jgi:hypothetical protein
LKKVGRSCVHSREPLSLRSQAVRPHQKTTLAGTSSYVSKVASTGINIQPGSQNQGLSLDLKMFLGSLSFRFETKFQGLSLS